VLLDHRADRRGAGGHGALDHGSRIVDDQQHPRRSATERLRAVVRVGG
jgi:hypothetical protein